MNLKRYDRSGRYAATHDFQTQPRSLFLRNIVNGFQAVTASIQLGVHSECSCGRWSSDYLETGLELLGYIKASSLVKKDFAQSASVFAEDLKKQATKVTK